MCSGIAGGLELGVGEMVGIGEVWCIGCGVFVVEMWDEGKEEKRR